MVSFVEIKTDNLQLAPGLKVLKAKDYVSYLDSQHLVEAANSKADSIIAKAQQAYETEKQRGYQDGLEQAKKKMRRRWSLLWLAAMNITCKLSTK